MKKNRVIQFSLVIVALILFFFTYYNQNTKKVVEEIDQKILSEDIKLDSEASNIISNAEYSGYDGGNNYYEIKLQLRH